MMKKLLYSMVLVFATVSVFAQVTTSSLTGTVRDAKETIIGGTVKATHVPSGTVYAGTTNSDGRFNLSNLRPGGPYTVEVSYVGYQTKKTENVYLKLGEPFSFNLTLTSSSTLLTEVVVTGGNSLLNPDRSGAVTNIGTRQINLMPSISRSINDVTRLTPQSNGSSVGGGNYRQNNITVDGSDFNNNFGIGTNLPANGSPISLDAIEEISVSITPFDVTQSGFIGSALNAVTRSGTNSFSGSAYNYFRTQTQQGSKVGSEVFTKQPLDDKTLGFRVGGPIIKNKLFFFINAEQQKTAKPGQDKYAATAAVPYGANSNVARPTDTKLNEIRDFLKNEYGYDPGIYQGYGFQSERINLLARLDWNINKNNRFNIRYSQVESKDPVLVNSTSAAPANFTSSNSRNTIQALAFSSANYFQEANFYSLSAELNSSLFGGKFSNTLRASYTNQNDPRSSDSSPFPFVDILDAGTPYTSFGYELFTYGNLRDVESYSFVDYLKWSAGKHDFTAGVQLDLNTTTNGFMRYGSSYYRYNSIAAFLNKDKPDAFALTYSLQPNFAQAFPTFKFAQYSAYFQDEYRASDKFKLTGGVRFDLPTYPIDFQKFPLVSDLTFMNAEKLDPSKLPSSKLLVSPRFGFNYDVKGDRSLQIRGGTGLFTGKFPFVWIVNQAGDSGLLQFTQVWDGIANTPGVFDKNPNAYRPAVQPVAGLSIPSSMTFISQDVKMPQSWKSSIAVDAKLPNGWIGSLEAIYNKDVNTAFWRNANLVNPSPLNVTGYADNRMFYPSTDVTKFLNPISSAGLPGQANSTRAFNAYLLENRSQGHYWSVTAKFDKQFDNGLNLSVAYVKSEAKNLYDGGGDQASSAWNGTPTVNGANSAELSHASYVSPDRVMASLTYSKEFFKHAKSTVSLFYSGAIDGRFSYTYSADFNRDGANADLIYVPNNATEIDFTPVTIGGVSYTAQQQSDMFFRFIEQDSYLNSRKGKYAERNGAKNPWRNQVDLKFLQDVFTNVGGKNNTIQFSFDVFNFGNLLNKNWGIVKTANARQILVPTNVSSLTTGGATKPLFQIATDRNLPATTTFRNNVSLTSTYYMQFGFRYIFN